MNAALLRGLSCLRVCCRYQMDCGRLFQNNTGIHAKQLSNKSDVKLSFKVFETNQTRVASHPVLILHGVLGSKKNWESLAKRMAQKLSRMIVTIDARNHGQSDHSATMSYEAMANDIRLLMERELKTEQCDLLGHSMGGRTGMAISLTWPELIRKLVVVDVTHRPPPQLNSDHAQALEFVRLMQNVNLNNSLSLHLARRDVGQQMASAIPHEGLRQFLLTNLSKEDGRLRWRLNLDALGANMDRLRTLDVPPGAQFGGETLFVGGSASHYLRPEDYPEIRLIFPNVTFTSIEGAGHWVHSEKPAEFLQAVVPFLGSS